MRMHIQGLVILLLVGVAVWATARLAGPALGSAFSGEGTVAVATPEDSVDLSTDRDDQPEAPLGSDEIRVVQFLLVHQGFLSGDDIDGFMGPITRAAMREAREAYAMVGASDRTLLAHLVEITPQPFGPAPEVGAE